MKANIPKNFKIGATPAHVGVKANLTSDEGYNAAFNKRTGELTIDDRLTGAKRDKSFGHEVNEVIKENYDLDFTEHEMTCVANGWLEFLNQLGITLDWSEIEKEG